MPIVELSRALRTHPVVELWADDPAVVADLEAFAEATGAHSRVVTVSPFRAVVKL